MLLKNIVGFEGLYKVSENGDIFSCKSDRYLKIKLNKYGYHEVGLFKDGKKHHLHIHKIVAQAFLEYKPDGTQKFVINHIDFNKTNNNVSNLEIVTNRYNVIYSINKNKKTSRFTGVSWHKASNRWISQIRINNNKKKHLGLFKCELAAAYAYNIEVNKLTNFLRQ